MTAKYEGELVAARRLRLGVLGGSFDPPHLAHLAIASAALEALCLERVLFVPAAAPPHKDSSRRTPAAVRLEMVELAVADDERFAVSSIEIDEGLVYTCDTLAALSRRFPEYDIVFLLGSDSLCDFDSWRNPEEILRLASLAVALRPGDDIELVRSEIRRWGADRITLLDLPQREISSSDLREWAAAGRTLRAHVPPAVEEFVVERGLYRRP